MPNATTFSPGSGDNLTFYLENFSKGVYADIVQELQYYTFSDLVANRKESVPRSERMTFNLEAYAAENTVATAMYDDDTVNIQDLGVKGTVYWHVNKTHFAYDVLDPCFGSNSAVQIVDYLKMREGGMYRDWFKQNETWLWTLPTAPNDGTAGKPLPLGIPYWVVQSATADFGFNGGVPSGYSSVAGVSSSLAGWKNGTAAYTAMNDTDFSLKLAKAMDGCNFIAPHNHGQETHAPDFMLYSSDKAYYDYQAFAFTSNDNTGTDLGKYRGGKPSMQIGVQYFRSVPWKRVPALSQVGGPARDLNEPIYGINWNWFKVKQYGDVWMKRGELTKHPTKHNVRVQWMDTGYQIECRNRRADFVIRNSNASAS